MIFQFYFHKLDLKRTEMVEIFQFKITINESESIPAYFFYF